MTIPRRPPRIANEAWDAYLSARNVYTAAPGPATRTAVQQRYRELCEAIGMSETETAEAEAILNGNNGWPELSRDIAA